MRLHELDSALSHSPGTQQAQAGRQDSLPRTTDRPTLHPGWLHPSGGKFVSIICFVSRFSRQTAEEFLPACNDRFFLHGTKLITLSLHKKAVNCERLTTLLSK